MLFRSSKKDYKPYMNTWQKEMLKALEAYYDSNLIANIMAPMFPDMSRNTLWVLKRKPGDYKEVKTKEPDLFSQSNKEEIEDDDLF